MRIRAFGPGEVLRRLFRLAESSPEDLAEMIQGVTEARAIRPWELFDEGIISWQIVANRQLLAGEFSMIGLAGFNNPGQWLVVVEEIRPTTASNIIVVRLSAAAVVFNNAAIVRPRLRDARFGNALVDAPLIMTTGTNVATFGTRIDQLNPAQPPARLVNPIVLPFGLPAGGSANILVLQSDLVNQSIDVVLSGLAIPWRDR